MGGVGWWVGGYGWVGIGSIGWIGSIGGLWVVLGWAGGKVWVWGGGKGYRWVNVLKFDAKEIYAPNDFQSHNLPRDNQAGCLTIH